MAKGHKRQREEFFRKTGDASLLRPGDLGYEEAQAAERLADELLAKQENIDDDDDWRDDPIAARYLISTDKK
ncbi:MAG: hypothetical protein H7Z37_18100 [Pyrinomonadaceae bacterium]|nr:hypothetical protein [Pyrinomonadaceae bacterium]